MKHTTHIVKYTNGEFINLEDDYICLTDLWHAAGSPKNKEPAQWLRTQTAREFIDALNVTMGATHSDMHSEVWTQRVKSVSKTWGHWQIALTYAKYLSAKFHIWCNAHLRKYFEGKVYTKKVTKKKSSVTTVPALDLNVLMFAQEHGRQLITAGIREASVLNTISKIFKDNFNIQFELLPSEKEKTVVVPETATVVEAVDTTDYFHISTWLDEENNYEYLFRMSSNAFKEAHVSLGKLINSYIPKEENGDTKKLATRVRYVTSILRELNIHPTPLVSGKTAYVVTPEEQADIFAKYAKLPSPETRQELVNGVMVEKKNNNGVMFNYKAMCEVWNRMFSKTNDKLESN